MSSGGSVGMAKKALQARSSNALRHSLKKKKTEAAEALSDAAAAAAYEGDDFNDDESLPIGESAGSTSPLLGNENSDDYGSGQVSVMRRRKSRGAYSVLSFLFLLILIFLIFLSIVRCVSCSLTVCIITLRVRAWPPLMVLAASTLE